MSALTITERQMRAMRECIATEFVVKCRDFIRDNFGHLLSATDDELDRMTRRAMAFGERIGIRKEISIQRLIVMQLEQGLTEDVALTDAQFDAIAAPGDEAARLDHLEELLTNGLKD